MALSSLILFQFVSSTASAVISFQSPQPVATQAGTARFPSAIRLPDGTLWVAWQLITLTGQTSIYLDTYNGGWSPVQTLISGPGTASNTGPTLARLQNGTIIIIFSSNPSGSYNLYYKTYNSGTWSSSRQLTSPPGANDYLPKAVVASDSTLWLFWERDSSSTSCLGSVCKQVYYKTLKGNIWSSETSFTAGSVWSIQPNLMATPDGRVWLTWATKSSTTAGFNIVYSFYNGLSWSSSLQLTTTPTSDTTPSLAEDRNGTLWLFFNREVILSNGQNGVSAFALYYEYSYNVGSTWVGLTQATDPGTSTNPVDSTDPALVQGADKMLYIFFTSDSASGGAYYDLFYVRSNVIKTHDITIPSIQYPSFQYPGGLISAHESAIVKFNVTVSNPGDFNESVNVSLIVSNSTSYNLGTQTGTVNAGSQRIFTFNWDTTGLNIGRYTLSATANPVVADEPTLNTYNNNVLWKGVVRLVSLGDVDQNGKVDIVDVGVMSFDYGFGPTGTPCPVNKCLLFQYEDLNNNGVIDIIDMSIVLRNFGLQI